MIIIIYLICSFWCFWYFLQHKDYVCWLAVVVQGECICVMRSEVKRQLPKSALQMTIDQFRDRISKSWICIVWLFIWVHVSGCVWVSVCVCVRAFVCVHVCGYVCSVASSSFVRGCRMGSMRMLDRVWLEEIVLFQWMIHLTASLILDGPLCILKVPGTSLLVGSWTSTSD